MKSSVVNITKNNKAGIEERLWEVKNRMCFQKILLEIEK